MRQVKLIFIFSLAIACLQASRSFAQDILFGRWYQVAEEDFTNYYPEPLFRDTSRIPKNSIYAFESSYEFSYSYGIENDPSGVVPQAYSGRWALVDSVLYMKHTTYNGNLISENWAGIGEYPDLPLVHQNHVNRIITLTPDSLVFSRPFECGPVVYYFKKMAER